MGQYYGIQKKNGSDIEHWKYIKKEYVNGKPRYYYDRSELNKDVETKWRDKIVDDELRIQYEETMVNDTSDWRSGKTLVSEKEEVSDMPSNFFGWPYSKTRQHTKYYYKNRGKIERAMNKAHATVEKVAYDAIFSEKSPANRLKNTGKNLVDKMLKRKK